MSDFLLHPQLQADCHELGCYQGCHVLLHRNGSLPWYIVVPESEAGELHELSASQRQMVDQVTDAVARFVKEHHGSQRTNVAAIGNRVPQLHIHVVGRSEGDPCWPDVVWGNLPAAGERTNPELEGLRTALTASLQG